MNALALITTFLPALIQAGGIVAQVWPQAAGVVGALAHVTAPSQQINVVSLVQEMLNALQASGELSFDGTGQGVGTPLTVDGHFGGRTFGAIKALQTKLGLTIQEPAASIELQLLQGLFTKL